MENKAPSLELTDQERKLISYLRDLRFGEVTIVVAEGKPKKALEVTTTKRWMLFTDKI